MGNFGKKKQKKGGKKPNLGNRNNKKKTKLNANGEEESTCREVVPYEPPAKSSRDDTEDSSSDDDDVPEQRWTKTRTSTETIYRRDCGCGIAFNHPPTRDNNNRLRNGRSSSRRRLDRDRDDYDVHEDFDTLMAEQLAFYLLRVMLSWEYGQDDF